MESERGACSARRMQGEATRALTAVVLLGDGSDGLPTHRAWCAKPGTGGLAKVQRGTEGGTTRAAVQGGTAPVAPLMYTDRGALPASCSSSSFRRLLVVLLDVVVVVAVVVAVATAVAAVSSRLPPPSRARLPIGGPPPQQEGSTLR